jgi:hypothetical protein
MTSTADFSRSGPASDACTHSAFDRIRAALEELGLSVSGRGNSLQAQCPAHDDRVPSLSVKRYPGRAWLKCRAGCEDPDVLAALNMRIPDLYDVPWSERRRAQAPLYDRRAWVRAQERDRARKSMTRLQKAVDDLLQLPNLGERISKAIAWHEAEEWRPDHWWWRAVCFHQAGELEIARACLNHVRLLSGEFGELESDQ